MEALRIFFKILHKQISCLIDKEMQVSWANNSVLRYKIHAIPNYLNTLLKSPSNLILNLVTIFTYKYFHINF